MPNAAGIDALVVTHLPNVRYLTGFTGSAAMLLVTADALVFTTDGRYRTQAAEQLARRGRRRARSRSGPRRPSSARSLARATRRRRLGSGSRRTR